MYTKAKGMPINCQVNPSIFERQLPIVTERKPFSEGKSPTRFSAGSLMLIPRAKEFRSRITEKNEIDIDRDDCCFIAID
jgi:hypothetical protein